MMSTYFNFRHLIFSLICFFVCFFFIPSFSLNFSSCFGARFKMAFEGAGEGGSRREGEGSKNVLGRDVMKQMRDRYGK